MPSSYALTGLLGVGSIAAEAVGERERAAGKHGRQLGRAVVPDGHWSAVGAGLEQGARQYNDHGLATWPSILVEEVGEALQTDNLTDLRAELVQVAAMAIAWVEAIDHQSKEAP